MRYVNPDRAYEIFEQVWEDLENYTGDPNHPIVPI